MQRAFGCAKFSICWTLKQQTCVCSLTCLLLLLRNLQCLCSERSGHASAIWTLIAVSRVTKRDNCSFKCGKA